MADVEIRGKISVNTGNTQKSVNEMLESIKQTKKALGDAKVGSEEYKAAQDKLKKQTDELNKTMDQSSGSFTKLKGTLGQVVPGLDSASKGAAGFGKQLWLLVANPIVAIIAGIVLALTLLFKAFTSTNEGADKMKQIMAGVGAAIDVLRDRVLAVGKAIGQFFSGDFKKALETGRAAVSGIGQEIADEFAAAADATRIIQELNDTMRSISISRAELNRDLAKAKEIMADSDASFAQRTLALRMVREKESIQNKKELKAAEDAFNAQVRLNNLSDTSDEDLDKETALKIRMIDLQTNSANQLRALNRMERTLKREEEQKALADQKVIDEHKKLAAEELSQFLLDLSALDAADKKKQDEDADFYAQREISRASALAQNRQIEYDRAQALKNQEKADEQALLEFKLAVYGQQLDNLATLGNTIQQFAGKNRAALATGIILEKAAAIGQILISGKIANGKSLAASPATFGQPFIGIQNVITGLQIASTIKAASTALGQLGQSDSGGSSSLIQSASAPLAPQRSSTQLDASSIQGVGNAAAGGVGRSFILDADIKSNQERQARIARAARLS